MTWLDWLLGRFGAAQSASPDAADIASPFPEAERIIRTRDYLNALLHERYHERVFLVHEERALLDLFKSCHGEEQFSHRVNSLATLVGALNEPLLRLISGSTRIGSINLLCDAMKTIVPGVDVSAALDALRDLVGIRNMFPTHRDNAGRAIGTCRRLGIGYPVADHNRAWTVLRDTYAGALERLLDVVLTLPPPR